MEIYTLATAAIGFVGSMIVHKVADEALEGAWNHLRTLIDRKSSKWPGEMVAARVELEPHLLAGTSKLPEIVQGVFNHSPALRRAQLVSTILHGAEILWVDDNPNNNVYERMAFEAFGIRFDLALSTDEAMSLLQRNDYDAVISDIARHEGNDAGIRMLHRMARQVNHPIVIFYTWGYDPEMGTPKGAWAITDRPDDLMHYVMDYLERSRV
jgi:hypothetical protein